MGRFTQSMEVVIWRYKVLVYQTAFLQVAVFLVLLGSPVALSLIGYSRGCAFAFFFFLAKPLATFPYVSPREYVRILVSPHSRMQLFFADLLVLLLGALLLYFLSIWIGSFLWGSIDMEEISSYDQLQRLLGIRLKDDIIGDVAMVLSTLFSSVLLHRTICIKWNVEHASTISILLILLLLNGFNMLLEVLGDSQLAVATSMLVASSIGLILMGKKLAHV